MRRAMRLRYLWYALGVTMIAWGGAGLGRVPARQLLHAARLLVLGLAGHDAVFAPLCALAGVTTARCLPRAARTPVRVGLGLAALLVILALPAITSEHRLRNPSVLPLDYERNLGLLLAMVATGVLLASLITAARHRAAGRSRRHAPRPGA